MGFGEFAKFETLLYAFQAIVMAGENAVDVVDVSLSCCKMTANDVHFAFHFEHVLTHLAHVEVNARRIRNIAKTAWVMAKREGRLIRFDDIKQVMRITEGLDI